MEHLTRTEMIVLIGVAAMLLVLCVFAWLYIIHVVIPVNKEIKESKKSITTYSREVKDQLKYL